MKKITKIGIIVGALVSIVISYHLFWLMHERANPHLLAIRQMLEEEHIQDFEVEIEYNDKQIIGNVTILANEAVYKKKDAFIEADRVQKIVCSYIVTHMEAFDMGYQEDTYGELYSEFRIRFENKDVLQESNPRKYILTFMQIREPLSISSNGMNRVFIYGELDEIDYNKISKIQFFPDVEEFSCYDMEIDDVNVVNHIKRARRIKLIGASGDVKAFKKKAKEKGIEVEGE